MIRTALLCVLGSIVAGSVIAGPPPGNPSTDASIVYNYDDINRFFDAYDRFMKTGKASEFDDYFNDGSIGLKNFESHFGLDSRVLAEKVQQYPAFFASIRRKLPSSIQSREAEFDATFDRLQALFPEHDVPQVFFLIGGLRAGGQAGEGNYVMVAAELYTDMPGVDLSEFSATSRMFGPQDYVHIIAHEAAHIIQENLQGSEQYLSIYTNEAAGTLMAYSLREGAANLVARLASGGHINERAEAYGLAHEQELWSIFREQAPGTDLGDWFFYTPKENPDWPRDLGYWMGYRMAQKCYEQAADKQATLLWILKADDPAAFMQECAL